jgi:hypothetical protein
MTSQIRCVYREEPSFPATDQHPDAVRYVVTVANVAYVVDAIGGEPTPEQVAAVLSPSPLVSLVRKSVIVDRLQSAGLLVAARAALDAADLYTRERWNTRDAIYSNDPTALAFLASIGANAAEILALDPGA